MTDLLVEESDKQKYGIRSIITAPEGYDLISIDLSAAEAWIVAYLANDLNMQRELREGDIHKFSASIIFQKLVEAITKEERYVGKKANHSLNYRTSAIKLAESINSEGIITVSVATSRIYWNRWHSVFTVKLWWSEIDAKLALDRTLITPYGRKRVFYGSWSDDLLKAATAYVPQSTVADHMNGRVQKDLGIEGGIRAIRKNITQKYPEIRYIQTAHDSLLIECPKAITKEIAERSMGYIRRPLVVNGHEFTIPVDCEIYEHRWGE